MSLILRCCFNNQNWKGRCINANTDSRLFKCQKVTVRIGLGKFSVNKNEECNSGCEEERICIDFKVLGNNGKSFDSDRAVGNIYFVYSDINNSLVLWGYSKIVGVKKEIILFEPFEPIQEKHRVNNLIPIRFLGKPWGSGRYRYLTEKQEENLKFKILKQSET